MQFSETTRALLIGAFGAIVSFFVFGGARGLGSRGPATQPIDAVPKDSFLVVTVDVAALRRSSLFEALFGKGDRDSELAIAKGLGMGSLADACGFDPLERVSNLIVAVPEKDGDHGEFGVIAHAEIALNELETCSRALLSKQENRTIHRKDGPFAVLEDPAHRKIAYGPGGLLIVGKGSWFDAMLGTAEHRMPSVEDAREHTALRRTMTNESGSRTPTVVVTALLPREMRDRLKSEMAQEGSGSNSSAIMRGVLGVSAVGLALGAGEAEQNVSARAELVCDDAEACAAVKKLLEQKKLDWSRDLGLRVAGFGALIDSLEMEENGAHLRASASVNASTLAGAIDRTIRWRSHKAPADANTP